MKKQETDKTTWIAVTPKKSRYSFRPTATEEQKAMVASKTVQDEPKGYVLLKQVVLEANKMGISTTRIVRAMGGNRGVGEPFNANWEFVYYKRSRWLPKACLKDLPKLVKPDKIVGRPKGSEIKPTPKIAKPKHVTNPPKVAATKQDAKILSKLPGMPVKGKATVRDSKGKIVQKVDPKLIPGTPVVLKKKKMTTEQAVMELGFEKSAPKPKAGKMSTTRTGATPKPKRSVNEAGIPVMDLMEE